MEFLAVVLNGIFKVLSDGIGRVVLRILSRGRYPGKSVYWKGACEIIGLTTVITGIIAIGLLAHALIN